MSNFHESRHPGEFILREANGQRSRDTVVIAPAQTVPANSILCREAAPDKITAAADVDADNAGGATIALANPAVTATVMPGRYRGVAIDATHVEWEDPAGRQIGTSVHGEAFDSEINLTITAGDTPTEANDKFYVDTVASPGGFQHVVFDPDSDAPIAGIAIYPATTGAGETVKIAAIVRDAEANGNCIAWPDGITAEQKADAEQALASLGIIVR